MGRGQVVVRSSGGLVGQPNPLSAPEGGLLQAENVVCDRENVIAEPRRGVNRYATLAATASALSEFKDRLIALQGTTLRYDSDGLGTMASYTGSFSSPDSYRMKFLEVAKSLFFTTSNGIRKNDSLTGTPGKCGMPQGLDISLTLTATAPTWFLDANQVAYRLVWLRKDANKRPIRGYPAFREVLKNTSAATKSVQLVTTIPSDVVAGDTLEIYRTELSGGAATDPGEELFKLAEVVMTSGDITAGTVTYNDTLDPIFLGDSLYTNPTEQTEDQGNRTSPFALDLAHYKGYTFYLNTRREHAIKLQLLDLAALTVDVSTITFTQGASTRTYTASTAEDIPNRKFKKETGLPTTSENIRETMKSLVRVMNRDAGQTFLYAYYTSQVLEPPGIIEVRSRDFTETAISVTANSTATGAGFTPTLPTSGTTVSSDNEDAPGRYYWSKLEQPDAVPLVNNDDIPTDSEGLRIIALQDSVIFLMEEGVWRLTGDTETSFVLKPLDPQIRFFAKDAAVLLDNSVFALSDQGVVRVSENGVSVMSWNTETDLKKIFSYASFQTITHGTGYNSERKYALWVPENSTDTYATIAYVYNFFTQKWTTWRKDVRAAHVMKSSDLLFLAHAVDTYVLKERKSFNTSSEDYMDEDIPVTITATGTALDSDGATVSTATVTYTYGVALAKGFLLDQPSTAQEGKVVTVSALGGTSYLLTLDQHTPALANGDANVSLPITCLVRVKPETGNNPGVQKFFDVVQLYMENDSARNHQIGFFSDVKPLKTYYNYYSVETNASAGWGNTPWGESPWGDDDPSISPIIRMDVPTPYKRASALSVLYKLASCKEKFSLLSVAYSLRLLTDRTTAVPREAS